MASQRRTHKKQLRMKRSCELYYVAMKLSYSSFTILVASASVGAISADDWHRALVHSSTTDWKQVISIVKPLLNKALMEHGDGSIASNAKASQEIDNYIDLTRFVTSNEKFSVTNVLDSGTRVDEQNGIETLSSFLTLSCICADYECNYPVAMDRDGVIDNDKPKYIGKTPLLFLDSDQKADCLSIFQLSSREMVLDNCDLDGTRRNESDYLHVVTRFAPKVRAMRARIAALIFLTRLEE